MNHSGDAAMHAGARADHGDVILDLKVQAGAKRTELAGMWNGAVKLKVGKKPEDGAANRECIGFLARTLGVPQNRVSIIKGEFSHLKTVRITGVDLEAVRRKLAGKDEAG